MRGRIAEPLQLLLEHGKEEPPIRHLRVDEPTSAGAAPDRPRDHSYRRNNA